MLQAGVASGSFILDTGYGASDSLGHAVVIHASDGTRIACGVLSTVSGGMSNADMISAKSSEPFAYAGSDAAEKPSTDDPADLTWLWVVIALVVVGLVALGAYLVNKNKPGKQAPEDGEAGGGAEITAFENPAFENPAYAATDATDAADAGYLEATSTGSVEGLGDQTGAVADTASDVEPSKGMAFFSGFLSA